MDFVGKRWWFFLLSGVVILAGIVSMLIPPAFRLGIEFTGGSALTLEFEEPVAQADLRAALADLGHPEAVVQRTGPTGFLVRTRTLEEAVLDEEGRTVRPGERERIVEALEERFGPLRRVEVATVSPIVAGETVRDAVIAVLVASVGILLYITWAFRRMPHPARMGTAALVALVHDVLVTLGVMSILGKFLPLEVNAMFITGVLTVVGYSVNDTIVVFDRLRETWLTRPGAKLEDVVNASLMDTLGRSLSTSITTLLVVLAVLLIGGPTIRTLLVTLLVGLVAGTYSSLFIAPQFLVVWERGEWLGPRRRRRPVEAEAPA